ncbi:MAG: N-acetyl-gamma-glutamyl-phosphate reductase [Bacillota bacterium]
MIKAGVLGTTGYAGIELVRYLKVHPEVDLAHLISNSESGKKLAEIYPNFISFNKSLEEYDIDILKKLDIVFTALPHGVAQDIVAELRENKIKVIDLSGDFRYKDAERYEKWYDIEHKYPELLQQRVYGLVEMNKAQIDQSELIANPGCYPTASTLGLLPIVNEPYTDIDSIIIDAKSGVSGAGKSLKRVTHFTEVDESVKAYGITTHRHTSEIEANLEEFTEENKINLSFTPHLIPMKRGILATIYIDLNSNIEEKEIVNKYKEFYQDSYFVKILDSTPDTKYVAGTNFCHIGINVDKRISRLIITSAIDNLGKGAAGQAVQNMNILFGLQEETGMEGTAIFP